MDVVKINIIPFLSNVSRVLNLGTYTELLDTKVPSIIAALIVVVDTYTSRGLNIMAVAADYAFEAIREAADFMRTGVRLNITSEDEHEPYIERFIFF